MSRVRRLPLVLLTGLVRGYRFFLSPWLGSSCRFEPTCSAYALQALEEHGAAAGTYITLGRLVRCHPWCDGGHDPVPARPLRLFARSSASTLDKTSSP
jgi:putative membrane protein insertion efficiency factor